MKKFFAKLINKFKGRMGLGEKRFREKAAIESQTEKERLEAEMARRGDKKYVSERVIPDEQEITGPSDTEKV